MEYKLRGRRVFVTKTNGWAYRAYAVGTDDAGIVLRNATMVHERDVVAITEEGEMWTVAGVEVRASVFLPWHRVEEVHIGD